MKKVWSYLLILVMVFSLFGVNTLAADTTNGEKILSFDDFKKATFNFANGGSAKETFDNTLLVTVDGVSSSTSASVALLSGFMSGKCSDGDKLKLSFTARLNSGGENGIGALQVQQEVPKTYTKCLFEKFELTSEFKTYTFEYIADAEAINFAVRFGFYIQSIEISDFAVYNMSSTESDDTRVEGTIISFDDFKSSEFTFSNGGSAIVDSDGKLKVTVDAATSSTAASIARLTEFLKGKCQDGDNLELSFTARLLSGGNDGVGTIQVQQEDPATYAKCIFEKFDITSELKTYTFKYTATSSAISFGVRFGFCAQVIEFTDFTVTNNGNIIEGITMPGIFADSMVLQRGRKIPVWGNSTNEGATVTVTLGSNSDTTTVKDGKWALELESMSKQKNLTMTVTDTFDTKTFSNVAIGDVILLMGQSNMSFNLSKAYNSEDLISKSSDYDVRRFGQTRSGSYTECDDVINGKWTQASPSTVGVFEAVGYIAAYQMEDKHDVTIGLIGCNSGSSLIETFMDYDLFETRDEYQVTIDQYNTKKESNNNWWVQVPSGLYNQMIHPIIPYSISSIIWYQGEANATRSELYTYQIYDLINDYREKFKNPDMPVCVVQLAPYSKKDHKDINQVFLDTHKRMKNVAVISTANEGPKGYENEEEIHPMTKIPVGNRVFYSLDNLLYGEEYEYSGPEYMYMTYKNKKPVLHFSHIGNGLKIADNGTTLKGFKASTDGINFTEVNATIDNDTVIIDMEGAVEVRYAFVATESDGTLGGNLTNDTNIPAFPFRATYPKVAFSSIDATKDNKNVKINVAVKNTGYSTSSPKIIIAEYNNGRLVTVKTQVEDMETINEKTASVNITPKNASSTFRVFLWDGAGSIFPYTSSEYIEVNQE